MRTYMCLQTYTGFHSEIILTMTVQAYAEQPATRKASTYHCYVCTALLKCRHCTELKWLCSGSLCTRIWLFWKIVLLCRFVFSFFLTKHNLYLFIGVRQCTTAHTVNLTASSDHARCVLVQHGPLGCSCAQGRAWSPGTVKAPPPPQQPKMNKTYYKTIILSQCNKEVGIFLLRRWLKPRFAHVCVYSAF